MAKTFLPLVFVLLCLCLRATEHDNCYKASLLADVIKRYHVEPRAIDDSLSSAIFDEVIKKLDPREKYFSRVELNKLEPYRYKLDDELLQGKCSFLQTLTGIYQSCVMRADTIVDEVLKKPLDFNRADTVIYTYSRKTYFAANRAGIERKWIKNFKYHTLSINNTVEDSTHHRPAKTEEELRTKLRKAAHEEIKGLLGKPGELDDMVADIYLQAISTRFDPHTEYLPEAEYKSWMDHVTAQQETYGLVWDENEEGDVVVDRVLPGSSAWKLNELNKGDVLLRYTEDGKEVVDVTMEDPEEILQKLDYVNSKRLSITVRKKSGIEKDLTLTKETLKLDENRLKSYVLEGPEKMGYIALPDFYTDESAFQKNGCANDLAKEILKLQKDDIKGLIIDLRNNGGGSMAEAMELAGIFIDEGPLFLIHRDDGKVQIMKDPNRGTIYNGDLVIMVNGFSASASEIFCGIMQDYNRAVIVGSSTYGKATMQHFMPLDTTNIKRNFTVDKSGLGYIKLTEGKLYRLNGSSHQRVGILPDVHMPDFIEKVPEREAFEPSALPNDTVMKKIIYSPAPALPLKQLAENSLSRQAALGRFALISRYADSLYTPMINGEVRVSLTTTAFKKFIDTDHRLYNGISTAAVDSSGSFTARVPDYDKELLKADDYRSDINNHILPGIAHDIYIREAYNILKDLVTFNKH